jgi:hypothetical protein
VRSAAYRGDVFCRPMAVLPQVLSRTLPVRATRWQLITILPKYWQPPALTE